MSFSRDNFKNISRKKNAFSLIELLACPPTCPAKPWRSGKPKERRQVRSGFSLIELLVVISILGVVTATIAACFSGGVRIWTNVRRSNKIEVEALIGLDIMARDIVNTFQFHDISFSGDDNQISFPALVDRSVPYDDDEVEPVEHVGTVGYFFDKRRGMLLRNKTIYPAENEDSGITERMMSNVEYLEFEYFPPLDNGGIAAEGHVTWDSSTNFPSAVGIEMVLSDLGEQMTFRRMVILPAFQQEVKESK